MAKHRGPQPHDDCAEHQRDQQARPARQQQFQGDAHCQCAEPQHQRRFIQRIDMTDQRHQAVERSRLIRQVQPQQIGQLPEGDHHRRAQGEPQHHGMGDEVHQGAEAQQAEQPLENASEERQQQDQCDVVL
ncbi:hypothetical protein D3C80_1356050 [compost metagenome]